MHFAGLRLLYNIGVSIKYCVEIRKKNNLQ